MRKSDRSIWTACWDAKENCRYVENTGSKIYGVADLRCRSHRSTYTVAYLREVGAKLWQLLAQALGEAVNKKNIRSIVQRYQQSLAVVALERQYFWGESINVSISNPQNIGCDYQGVRIKQSLIDFGAV